MAGGVITTGAHPKALWPGVHAFWGQVYNAYPAEYPDLYDWEDSDQAYEEDVPITGFGVAPVKAEGAPGSYDFETQGTPTRFTHIAYSLGWKVTYEELKSNKYETIANRRSKANAFSMNQTIEIVSASVYNDAFTGAVFTMYDGLSMVNPAHLNFTGGTFSNALTPGADLMEASLEDAVIQIMGFQTDRGLLAQFMPESLHVPRQEIFNAKRILGSVQQSGTNNNDINALRSMNVFPKGVKPNHFFSNPHAWFIRTNCPNGMTGFWREKPNLSKDNDFDTKNAKALAYMWFSVGCTDPRSILGSNGP